jgi:hypothetical protein
MSSLRCADSVSYSAYKLICILSLHAVHQCVRVCIHYCNRNYTGTEEEVKRALLDEKRMPGTEGAVRNEIRRTLK